MQLKRDYSQPFFRAQPRRRSLRGPIILLLLLLLGTLVLANQPGLVLQAAYAIAGIQQTPTPLPTMLAQQANERYWRGDLSGAADLYRRALLDRPQNVEWMYELGQILIDDGQPGEALALAERILALDPNDVRGFTLRTRGLTWQGNGTAAIPVGLAGLQVNPNFAPLYAALTSAYTVDQKWREAQEYGQLAVEMAPNDVRAHWAYSRSLSEVGARDEAINQLERTVEVHPYFLPPYFELAILYLAANRDREAIDTYDRILGLQPRNARALLRQCQAYRKVGEFNRALGLCQDAVDSDPSFVPAQYQIGLLRYNQREFEAARTAFSACLSVEPGNLECHFRLGLTLYYLGECRPAWDQLQDSLLMAQSQSSEAAQNAIELIRQGLSAVSSDPACLSSGIRPLPTPTATPETEATPEVESSEDSA